jgi:FMN phosphatase YigB (HAD superfamily)
LTRSSRPAKTALFDLDGTLLPVELDFFLKHYMDALARSFAAVMSKADFDNVDPTAGNLDVFARAFTMRTNLAWNDVWPVVRRYYAGDYLNLRALIPGTTAAPGVIQQCVDDGWEIIMATQPLFPEVAIRERMKWCGVDAFPWRLITTVENMHFCKPHVQYYQEILDMTGLDPSRCVMIGNDVQQDVVAKKLG